MQAEYLPHNFVMQRTLLTATRLRRQDVIRPGFHGNRLMQDRIVVLEQGTRLSAGLIRELGTNCVVQPAGNAPEVMIHLTDNRSQRLLICDAASLPEPTISVFKGWPHQFNTVSRLVLLNRKDESLTPLLLRLGCLVYRFHPLPDRELGQLCRNLLKLQKS